MIIQVSYTIPNCFISYSVLHLSGNNIITITSLLIIERRYNGMLPFCTITPSFNIILKVRKVNRYILNNRKLKKKMIARE